MSVPNCNKDIAFYVTNEKLQFFFPVVLHFPLFHVFTKAKRIFVKIWNSALIPEGIKSFWNLFKGMKVQALTHTPAQVTL